MSQVKKEKEKEYLKSESSIDGKKVTIGDLFTKYNI